ncbi:transposase family protein, partial [Bacillus alveayuensis]|uniref:transposase family protein n=1 Tax=Aeribacillus alveayuensis TaxID=279215 RepID=UPI003898FF58
MDSLPPVFGLFFPITIIAGRESFLHAICFWILLRFAWWPRRASRTKVRNHRRGSFLNFTHKYFTHTVEIFYSGEEQGVFWFELHTCLKMQKCPKCKSRTKRIHSYRNRMQKIQFSSVVGKRVYLHVKKRRYRCTTCGHTFYEKLSFVDRYQR